MHQAYVQFDNDVLTRIMGFQKVKPEDPDYKNATSPYRDKLVNLEVLCNSEIVSTYELNLTKYIGNDEVQEKLTNGNSETVKSIQFNIEVQEIIDESPMLALNKLQAQKSVE